MAELMKNEDLGSAWACLAIETEPSDGEIIVPLASIAYFGFNPIRGKYYVKTKDDQHEYTISEDEYTAIAALLAGRELPGD